MASKSVRLTWDPSISEVSGYKVQMIPMMTGVKRQELYVGPTQTSVVVRDLSPDVEYQINLYALKGLTPSEPITAMQRTEPVKVSVGESKNSFYSFDTMDMNSDQYVSINVLIIQRER